MVRKAPGVDAYITRAPEFARPILKKLRLLFHKASPEMQESIKWGVPFFEQNGIVGGFAAFKQHVGLGFWKGKLLHDPLGLFKGKPTSSMCSIKITSAKDLPSNDDLLAYICEAIQLNESDGKPARKSPKKSAVAVGTRPTVDAHFADRPPGLRATYDAILAAARKFGAVEEDPKKGTIHLNRKSAFAGVALRRSYILLTLKSNCDLKSSRVVRREHSSANRWHLEIKIASPKEVDSELKQWIKAAYQLSK